MRRTVPLLLMLLAVVAGCSGNRSREARVEPRETTLEVNNQAWMDMTIYVVDGGRRVRLGSASSARVTRLRIPDSVIGFGRVLRFQADPVGSTNVANSFEINVSQGQTVRLTIPPNAGR